MSGLAVYVNDHLAGGAGALRLCSRIVRTTDDAEVARRVAEVRAEIERDRETLDGLRRALGIRRSRLRDAFAAALQAASRLKLRHERSNHGKVGLLHALDLVVLGIEGKKALWSALAAAAQADPRLRLADYDALLGRADAQIEALRPLRRRLARVAFAAPGVAGPDSPLAPRAG